MEKFTRVIVDMVKKEKLFAPQGGPIILSQVLYMINLCVLFFIVFKIHDNYLFYTD